MTDRFESILDECISALQAGIPIDEILTEVPDYADELRPLLYAAAVLADPKPDLPPEETKLALRAEYIKQVAELPAIAPATFTDKIEAVFRIMHRRLTRKAVLNDLFTISITIILTLLMAGLLLNYIVGDALPGDLLYNIKRASENIQLSLTFSEARQIELLDEFNQRRLQEIEQLIKQDRAAMIQFRGVLETKGEKLWIIEGHTIFLPENVYLEGEAQEGDLVEVIGLLRSNNVLVADTIRVVE